MLLQLYLRSTLWQLMMLKLNAVVLRDPCLLAVTFFSLAWRTVMTVFVHAGFPSTFI